MSDGEPLVFSQLQPELAGVVLAFFLGTIPAKHLSMCLIKSCEKFKGLWKACS